MILNLEVVDGEPAVTIVGSSQKELFTQKPAHNLGAIILKTKLLVDSKEIGLNEFVEKFLSGTIAGAVTSLRGVKEDWKKIEITVEK